MVGIPALFLIYGNLPFEESVNLMYPIMIGVPLLVISVSYGMKKFDRYLENWLISRPIFC